MSAYNGHHIDISCTVESDHGTLVGHPTIALRDASRAESSGTGRVWARRVDTLVWDLVDASQTEPGDVAVWVD